MYLSVRKYAEKFDISETTVRRLIKAGRLEAVRISSRCIRIDEAQVPVELPEYKPGNMEDVKARLRRLTA